MQAIDIHLLGNRKTTGPDRCSYEFLRNEVMSVVREGARVV